MEIAAYVEFMLTMVAIALSVLLAGVIVLAMCETDRKGTDAETCHRLTQRRQLRTDRE